METAKKIASEIALTKRAELLEHFKASPIPDEEKIRNLGLFLLPQELKKFLFLNDLYQKVMDVHGVIMEFGVRLGQNLSVFQSLRSIYEPYNHSRKIVGFDTFEGFKSIKKSDGNDKIIRDGALTVPDGYDSFLRAVLRTLEYQSPISELQKFEVVKGNATVTVKKYLKQHPETIVALAYFDLDIYQPTRVALQAILSRVPKGGIICFDELNCPIFPGETLAYEEVLGIRAHKLRRSPFSHLQSYVVME